MLICSKNICQKKWNISIDTIFLARWRFACTNFLQKHISYRGLILKLRDVEIGSFNFENKINILFSIIFQNAISTSPNFKITLICQILFRNSQKTASIYDIIYAVLIISGKHTLNNTLIRCLKDMFRQTVN